MKPIPYTAHMTMLSPIHVGSGDCVFRYDYFEGSDDDFTLIQVIDKEKFFAVCPPAVRAEFITLVEKRNTTPENIQNWFVKHIGTQHKRFTRFSMVRNDNRPLYASTGGGIGEIKLMPRDIRHNAYIPGSSVKGAIRTALLRMCARAEGDEVYQRPYIERTLIPRIDEDPFNHLKIGDFPHDRADTAVAEALELKFEGTPTPKGFFEMTVFVTDPEQCDEETFNVTAPCAFEPFSIRSSKIDLTTLCRACLAHYQEVFDIEYNSFYKKADDIDVLYFLDTVRTSITAIKPENNETLIRVGRFSHREAMVFHPEKLKGKTRAYAADFEDNYGFPFGWAKIRFER